MTSNIVSAVFDDRAEAERAVSELRSAGIPDSAISLVGRPDDNTGVDDDDRDGAGKGSVVAAVAGGGVAGAILGVAALAIPGVGPLVAAGAIAASAAPTAAAVGAAAGATAGAIARMLTDHEVEGRDAEYYEQHIERGGIFVSVDTRLADGQAETAQEILNRHGGHNASQPSMATTHEADLKSEKRSGFAWAAFSYDETHEASHGDVLCDIAGRYARLNGGRTLPIYALSVVEPAGATKALHPSPQNLTSTFIVNVRPRGSATRGSHELPAPELLS